jgi:hypothetical protein
MTEEAKKDYVSRFPSDLDSIPGVGDANKRHLRSTGSTPDLAAVTTSYQLLGIFLSLRGENMDEVTHCNLFWNYLTNKVQHLLFSRISTGTTIVIVIVMQMHFFRGSTTTGVRSFASSPIKQKPFFLPSMMVRHHDQNRNIDHGLKLLLQNPLFLEGRIRRHPLPSLQWKENACPWRLNSFIHPSIHPSNQFPQSQSSDTNFEQIIIVIFFRLNPKQSWPLLEQIKYSEMKSATNKCDLQSAGRLYMPKNFKSH